MSDAPTLLERLGKVQVELKAPKSQRNTFGNYNYRNCEDILEAVKPLLANHGLVLVLEDDLVNIGERYYVTARAEVFLANPTNQTRIGHSSRGYAREEETKKGMDGSQITGAASSYARKYALNGLFLIDDTKDSDATNQGTPAPKPAAASTEFEDLLREVRTTMFGKKLTGEDNTKFCQLIIGKDKPNTVEDLNKLLEAMRDL